MSDEPIISTKDRIGDFDALETAKIGEPIFVIQGGDPLGPPTVEYWADLQRTAGRREEKPEIASKMLKKATAAEIVAWSMRSYQHDPETIAQAEEQKTFEMEDLADRKVILARAADRLHNALAEAIMVAEKLEALDESLMSATGMRIRDAAATLSDVARTIEPRRHMQRRAS